MKAILAATLKMTMMASMVFAAASAQALECKGEDMSFKLDANKLSQIEAKDPQVKANLLEASAQPLESQELKDDKEGFTRVYEGTFKSASPQGLGIVQIVINEKTGKAMLGWDNGDGGMLGFDVVCK